MTNNNFFECILYLRSDTNLNDVKICIEEFFLNKRDIEQYSWTKGGGHWNCFSFLDLQSSVKISFSEKNVEIEKEPIHYFIYEEKLLSESNQFYCIEFLNSIKKFIPNKYTKISCFNKTSLEAKACENLIGCKQICPSPQKKTLPLLISFWADENGKFFFDHSWIAKIVSDLWFLGADFRTVDGTSAIKKQVFEELKKAPASLAKKLNKHSKKEFSGEFARKELDDWEKYVSNAMDKFLAPLSDSLIELTNLIYAEAEIKSDDFKNVDLTYEALCDCIIKKFPIAKEDFEKRLSEEIPDFFYLRNDLKCENEIKFQQYLKEKGIDGESFKRISRENEALRSKDLKSERAINELNGEIETLKKNLENEKKRNVSEKTNQDSMITKGDDAEVGLLKEENKKLHEALSNSEKEKTKLEEDLNNTNERNKVLEKRMIEKQHEFLKGVIDVRIPCTEKNLFIDEIQDFLYNELYSALEKKYESFPANKKDENYRIRDVISNILDNKKFNWKKSETYKKNERIKSIFNSSPDSRKPPLDKLEQEGFFDISAKNHPKRYFYEERYQITFSNSSSDGNVAGQRMREIEERFFLS